MLIAGVDEAGRGCVIGPLVISGYVIKEKNLCRLIELGVKDSKKLSRKSREMMMPRIIINPMPPRVLPNPSLTDSIISFNDMPDRNPYRRATSSKAINGCNFNRAVRTIIKSTLKTRYRTTISLQHNYLNCFKSLILL